MMRLTILAAGLVLLAGCGLRGDLVTPGPMWGAEREATERELPGSEQAASDRIVFTREDVHLFREDLEEVDPFEFEVEEGSPDEGVPPLNPKGDIPPQTPPD